MIADTTITSVWVPVEEPLLAHDIFSGRMAAVGDRVFILLDNVLYEYTLGDSLTLKNTMKLEDDYEELSADQNGNLYLTGFMSPMLTVKDGQIIAANDDIDKAVIHSSGTWGLSWFFGSEPEKVVFDGNKASKEAWSGFSNESINTVSLSENHIFIAGEDPDTHNEAIWVLTPKEINRWSLEIRNSAENSLWAVSHISRRRQTDLSVWMEICGTCYSGRATAVSWDRQRTVSFSELTIPGSVQLQDCQTAPCL